jgi:hypothetical protein
MAADNRFYFLIDFEEILKKYAIAQNAEKKGSSFLTIKICQQFVWQCRTYELQRKSGQMAISNHVHSHFIIINNKERFFNILNLAVYIVFCKFNAFSSPFGHLGLLF